MAMKKDRTTHASSCGTVVYRSSISQGKFLTNFLIPYPLYHFMGTTESAFFYEDSTEDASPSPSTHSGHASLAPSATPPLPRTKAPSRTATQRSPTIHRLVKLKGHILGLPESGKRTLLARLQGKDPFLPSSEDDIAPVLEGVEHLLPYQAPPDQPSWDRIQLLVHCAEDFVQTTDPLDFVVILINPREKRKKVKRYLVEQLRRFLHMLGYRPDGKECYPMRPLCLCLLLNFRDLALAKTQVEESNVTLWTMEVLQEYPTLDPQRLVLQSGRTSLKNCYGLSLLHHFIYQSYLSRRQYQLEVDLLQVRQTRQHAKEAAPTVQDYDDFLAILDGRAIKKEKKKNSRDNGDNRRRRVMPTEKHVVERPRTPPPLDPPPKTNALEAFLASSDEEVDNEERKKTTHNRISNAQNGRDKGDHDDDDDDDDFVVEQMRDEAPEPSDNSEAEPSNVRAKAASEASDVAVAPLVQTMKSPVSTAESSDASLGSGSIVESKGGEISKKDERYDSQVEKPATTEIGSVSTKEWLKDESQKQTSTGSIEGNENDHETATEDDMDLPKQCSSDEIEGGDADERELKNESQKRASPINIDIDGNNHEGLGEDNTDPLMKSSVGEVEDGHADHTNNPSDGNGHADKDHDDSISGTHDIPKVNSPTQKSTDVNSGKSVLCSDVDQHTRLKTRKSEDSSSDQDGRNQSVASSKVKGIANDQQESESDADSYNTEQAKGAAAKSSASSACTTDIENDGKSNNETPSSHNHGLSSRKATKTVSEPTTLKSASSPSIPLDAEGESSDEEFFVGDSDVPPVRLRDDDSQKKGGENDCQEKPDGREISGAVTAKVGLDGVRRSDGDSDDSGESEPLAPVNQSEGEKYDTDDNDDEYVIDESSVKNVESIARTSTSKDTPAPTAEVKPPSSPSADTGEANSSGLSAAARAAIAAAQKDFESMLQPSGVTDVQKKKKKKDKDAKEKKKDKKKRKDSVENVVTHS